MTRIGDKKIVRCSKIYQRMIFETLAAKYFEKKDNVVM